MESVDYHVSSPGAAQILSKFYDNYVGIGNKDELIGPVLYREEEDILATSRYSDMLKIYVNNSISDLYGISITEFLELPSWRISIMISESNKELERKSKEIERIENEANMVDDVIYEYDDEAPNPAKEVNEMGYPI